MFYHDGGKLQFEVRVDKPNPLFAKALQQAIGGVEGEMRVCLQYLFQAWGTRGNKKYRDLLLETGTEEMGHIEMLATAVALNLEGAPLEMDKAAKDPIVHAALGGMNIQHVIRGCLAALPVDTAGVPFDGSHIYASGNPVADMLANVTAESTGQMLACQLYKMTDDSGMKKMLSFLIARDTMHQNQWLAAWRNLVASKLILFRPLSHRNKRTKSSTMHSCRLRTRMTWKCRKGLGPVVNLPMAKATSSRYA